MEPKGKFTREIAGRIQPAGEITTVVLPMPENSTLSNAELEGKCGCGGKLVKSKKEVMVWKCEKDNWWRFWSRKHAKIKVEMEVLPQPLGSA